MITFIHIDHTARTQIVARTLELPLLVRSSVFFFFVSETRPFLVLLGPFPEEENLDYLAHGPTFRLLF